MSPIEKLNAACNILNARSIAVKNHISFSVKEKGIQYQLFCNNSLVLTGSVSEIHTAIKAIATTFRLMVLEKTRNI